MSYSVDDKNNITGTICDYIVDGLSVKYIFDRKLVEPSRSQFYAWLVDDKELSDKYARAMELRAEILFDEVLDIADDQESDIYIDNEGLEQTNHNVIARSRLRVDARKWAASKLNPKKYGDKIDLTTGGDKINRTPIFGDNPLDNNVQI